MGECCFSTGNPRPSGRDRARNACLEPRSDWSDQSCLGLSHLEGVDALAPIRPGRKTRSLVWAVVTKDVMNTTRPFVTDLDLTRLQNKIRLVPGFPKAGILFRDITTVLSDPETKQMAAEAHLDMIHRVRSDGGSVIHDGIDQICGIESRGFLFGMVLADRLGVGFFPARKPGKLPAPTIEATYELEYDVDRIQIHVDAIKPGDRVLIVDDLLATGGTAEAVAKLVERLGGIVVGVHVLIELEAAGGRAKLGDRPVESVFRF